MLSRLDKYLQQYEETLAAVVAEERYVQVLESARGRQTRQLVSDYALARAVGGHAWTGFRDTYELDGSPVRDREDRLARLLADGTPDSAQQAMRISRENARYNIGEDVATRTVNVPTVALDLIHPRNRSRFSFRKRGEETVDGRRAWILAFTERDRPTIVKTPDGNDQRTTGTVVVDSATGEVLRTSLHWEEESRASITVDYRVDDNLGALVPGRMAERYSRGAGTVAGEATYTKYRRFQTSARIVGDR